MELLIQQLVLSVGALIIWALLTILIGFGVFSINDAIEDRNPKEFWGGLGLIALSCIGLYWMCYTALGWFHYVVAPR